MTRALALLIAAACSPIQAPSASPIALRVEGDTGACWGIWTGAREVTTAEHCVSGPILTAYDSSDRAVYGRELLRDSTRDVVQFATHVRVEHWAALRFPRLGERTTHGTIVVLDSWGFARLESTARPGDSGLPVFGADGAVVCMLTGREPKSGRAWCTTLEKP